jgi:hypothetical protein
MTAAQQIERESNFQQLIYMRLLEQIAARLRADRIPSDGHPLDLDPPGEFMFGPDILIAASPSPEEVAPYEAHLPPGLWHDCWTGARLDRMGPATVRHSRDAQTIVLHRGRGSWSAPQLGTAMGLWPLFLRGGRSPPWRHGQTADSYGLWE